MVISSMSAPVKGRPPPAALVDTVVALAPDAPDDPVPDDPEPPADLVTGGSVPLPLFPPPLPV
jgi:hypothetical protein